MIYDSSVNSQILGMFFQDYNFLMGLSGLLVGFLTLYFMLAVFKD